VIQSFLSMSGDGGYGDFGDAEAQWPADANDGTGSNGYPAGPLGANTTGSTLVKNTLATPGTIGYAELADAAFAVPGNSIKAELQTTTYNGTPSHQYLFAGVQSDEGATGTRHYAVPGTVTTNSSGATEAIPNLYTGSSPNFNCSYSLTQTSGVGESCVQSSPWGATWAGTLASDPAVYTHSAPSDEPGLRVDNYPIVEVTWDVVWTDYSADKLPTPGYYNSPMNATDTGNTVASYIAWITKPTGGQAAIDSAKVGYEELPSDG
jgi:hypothetical protein